MEALQNSRSLFSYNRAFLKSQLSVILCLKIDERGSGKRDREGEGEKEKGRKIVRE